MDDFSGGNLTEYLLGIDIGTSGCKSILINGNGEIAGSTLFEYPLSTPKPGWSEQNPEDWWGAVVKGIRSLISKTGVTPSSIKALGLSGQMHGLVALDESDRVIRPAILWNDQRTSKQCDEITEKAGGLKGLLSYTNNRMLPGYTGGKILWLKEEEPENYDRMKYFLNPKDYIRFRLTGVRATEVSDASGTGLFNVKKRDWARKLISKLGMNMSIFPVCYESGEVSGKVASEVSELTGLPKGLPVVGGGGDAVIQTTGMGLIKSGVMGTIIGTSGIVAMGLEGYMDNPEGLLQVFCNNTPSTWHAMGVTLNAGGTYRWFRDAMAQWEMSESEKSKRDVYEILDELAASVPPGSNKLLFLPYLIGERCPYTDPAARGAFIGLGLHHGKGEIVRSILEGVVFSLMDVYKLMKRMGIEVIEIRTSGGGSLSPLWRQIQADVFQAPVVTVSGSGEGGAYGAALVAGAGVGVWSSVEEAVMVLKKESENLPNPSNRKIYKEMYDIYHNLYGALKPTFDALYKL